MIKTLTKGDIEGTYINIIKASRIAGHKINIQKSVVFLYTNNEILEEEYKNTIPSKITPQKLNT